MRIKAYSPAWWALLLLAFLPFAGGFVSAQAQSTIEMRNKAIVQERFSAWMAGTGSPYDLLAEEATWTIVGHSAAAKTYRNRDAFLSEVIQPFNARMREGLKPAIRELAAEGDRVIVIFDGSALARDGRPYSNTYAWFLTLKEGKIVSAIAFFDSITFNDLWARIQPVP